MREQVTIWDVKRSWSDVLEVTSRTGERTAKQIRLDPERGGSYRRLINLSKTKVYYTELDAVVAYRARCVAVVSRLREDLARAELNVDQALVLEVQTRRTKLT